MVKLLEELVEDFFIHIAHGILLLRILTDLGNPCTTGFDVVFVNMLCFCLGDFLKTIVVEDHLIGPRPAVFAIIVVDLHKAVKQLLDVIDVPILDVANHPQLLTLRQEKTTQIRPTTFTHKTLRTSEVALLLGTFQYGAHIDAQGDVVILQALPQR